MRIPAARATEPGETYGNVIEFSLDSAQAMDGSYDWFIESPGIIIPATQITPEENCNLNLMNPGEWGAISIKVDLFIDNKLGGPVYDLYIMDPCGDIFEDAKRVHLQFRDNLDFADRGSIYMETFSFEGSCAFPEDGFRYLGDYFHRQWLQLHIRINSAEHFELLAGETQPTWNGGGNSVRVDWHGPEKAGESCVNKFEPELGRLTPTRARGVQFRISSSNQDCNCTALGTDEINPGTSEYWSYRLLCPEVTLQARAIDQAGSGGSWAVVR